ncbi:MAG: two-component sensor histidine kinase [Marinilabiliales bacterium]|nr:MAG: two-component sensor histidine kinase [Marinilabiliales bacterium]
MKLSFKNRIAFQYLIATAIVVTVVFITVFLLVENIVYENIDHDLLYEANKHTTEITFVGDSIKFTNKAELEEREHREPEVNPIFIQIVNNAGILMDKSPNLKQQSLIFDSTHKIGTHFNAHLNGKLIRQVQISLKQNSKTKGYVLAAISMKASSMILNRLAKVLLISFPIILIGLFFISQFLAGKNIMPIRNIIETTKKISGSSLDKRVETPQSKDELYELSVSINSLLKRIQDAFDREQQFTSDASHELRTPISSIRGNLEVLIRKKRKPEEYNESISYCLNELDTMSDTIDQLLLLARLESQYSSKLTDKQPIVSVINEVYQKYTHLIESKKLNFITDNYCSNPFYVASFHANLLFENLLSNAIKYTNENGEISIKMRDNAASVIVEVTDNGIGIDEKDVDKIFTPFYRSNPLQHKHIIGNGLGLSIAQKAADALNAEISVSSKLNEGTSFLIILSKS